MGRKYPRDIFGKVADSVGEMERERGRVTGGGGGWQERVSEMLVPKKAEWSKERRKKHLRIMITALERS